MPPEQDVFLEDLYRNNAPKLMIYATSKLRDPSGVEELVQDTFYTAVTHMDRLRTHSNPEAYLMTVLQYKIKEYQRIRRRELMRFRSLDPDLLNQLRAPEDSSLHVLETIRKALSQEEYHLFQRYYLEGAHHIEIARELHISVWNSQKRLERIRKKLKKCFPDF